MNIAKQIVDNQIVNLLKENPDFFADITDPERKKSKAFLLLAVSAYLETEISDTIKYLTDGGADGGFDAAYISTDQDSQINVTLFQSKYTRDLDKDSNFPANAVEKAVNTIKGVFDPQKNLDLNVGSQKVVTEIHSYLLDGYIPNISFVCLNNGLGWNSEGQKHIDNNFGNQKQVEFIHFNHDNIISFTGKTKQVNATIHFKGSAIREDFNYKSVLLGRICVTEIHQLLTEHGDALLEKNIRRYLGRNNVNEGIRNSLISENKRNNFFFFNNGITIICKKFTANFLQEKNWIVKLEDMQIINGGQTCKTIFQTIVDYPDNDYSDVDVLIRLYEVNDDEKVIQDITFATNSQNPVDFRDLKSNEDEQILLEQSSKELGYVYKRKRDNLIGVSGSIDTIPSSVAAEAVLSVWKNKPHLAKHKKNEFFSTYYDEIFKDLNAAQMIIAVLIFRFCDNNRRKSVGDAEIQAQRGYNQYFMASLIGQQLLLRANISIEKIDHRNFELIKKLFENIKDELYSLAEKYLVDALHTYTNAKLSETDGRTIAAIFRRFDVVERFIKNCPLLLN